ncbi:hypothetical protein ACS0TY_029704 [Phlomoides rotata]
MIVRVGFLVAASIAAYAVRQINVKSPKREDDLKKPSGLLGFGFLLLVCLLRQKRCNAFPGKLEKGGMSPDRTISRGQDANNKLVFFEGCNYAFDLEDLLRASAEVLGKGTSGTAYKAILEDAMAVVVKRLKEVYVGKKDFEQQMDIIGSIKHENVAELKAYYYSKDEKLMVYDYYNQDSLALMLHVRQINVKSPKREDDLKKPLDLENDDALINEEEEKLHVTCSNNGLNEGEEEEEKEEVKLINSIINPAPSSPPDYEDDFLPEFESLLSTTFVKGRIQ